MEMARGWLSKSPCGMHSDEAALERMGHLMAYLHQGGISFETDADENIHVVVGKERFWERASPTFPSEQLVARVALAVKFCRDEDYEDDETNG